VSLRGGRERLNGFCEEEVFRKDTGDLRLLEITG
jgi:hypothetical protein